jgi:hypothetical protein
MIFSENRYALFRIMLEAAAPRRILVNQIEPRVQR